MVLATARGILGGDHHSAEDVVQTTFVALARRGGAIRRFETLGPWLHRVACREANRVRVRQRRQAARERLADPRSPESPGTNRDEVRAAVHAELDRLPASYRLPIVLCDLEGWTKASAAAHLGWTEGAVRGRLERGRARLRVRLTRQGFAPAIGSVAAVLGISPAAMASEGTWPGLVAAATRAAMAVRPVGWVGSLVGAAGSGVSIRSGLVAVGLAGSVGLAGAVGYLWWRPAATATAPAAKPAVARRSPPVADRATPPPTPAVAPAVGPERPGDLVIVVGQVVAPDGQPVGGATVQLKPHVGMLPPPAETVTTADAAGEFRLPVPRHLFDRLDFESAVVAAEAPAWGLGYITLGNSSVTPADRVTIRLTRDDAPLEGRIIDLEGKPVAGASLRVGRLTGSSTADLTAWADQVRLTGASQYWPEQSGINAKQLVDLGSYPGLATTADAAGQFRLNGLGRERLVSLIVAGRGIATTEVHATTQTRGPIVTTSTGESRPSITIHASRVDLALPPGRSVAGIVRDADTGAPIGGVHLQMQVLGGYDENLPLPGVEVVSDDQGHYRLDGLPLATRYRIFVRPRPGQPYPRSDIPTPPQEPGATRVVVADLSLRRGVLVRGRVTNKATGAPVVNAGVESHPKHGTPEIARYPNLDRDIAFARTDTEGKYEIVALPGSGLLMVGALGSWQLTRDFETMEGYDPKLPLLRGFPSADSISLRHAIVPIQVEPGSSPVVNLTVDPGVTVRVTVVDPKGQPVVGTTARGLTPFSWPSGANPTAAYEVKAIDPTRPRRIFVFHTERHLAASVLIRGDEAESVVVRLAPSGSAIGRLVEERGELRAGFSLMQSRDNVEAPGRGTLQDDVIVGNDGRFRIDGLIPGLLYRAQAATATQYGGQVLEDFAPQPGVTTDLGDIKMRPPAGN